MSQVITQTRIAAQATVAADAPVFSKDSVAQAAALLCASDRAYENGVKDVATEVARIMGEAPSYSLWTAVQAEFVLRYTEARACKEETSGKRWLAVAGVMETEFALEKPAKPTKAAETKAAQRSDAATKAAEIIATAKATTPAELLKLSGVAGTPGPVAKALVAEAGKMVADATKGANDAAKVETKTLRESIRKSLAMLSLGDLRKVGKMIDGMLPVADDVATPESEVVDA